MARPVTFLQSLLVLVVAIHVESACRCGKPWTLESVTCANLTTIMATPIREHLADQHGTVLTDPNDPAALFTRYDMYVNTVYHDSQFMQSYRETFIETKQEGHYKIGNYSYFYLMTARSEDLCGVKLDLKKEYWISGSKYKGKIFVHCADYVENVPWYKKSLAEFEAINDILTRQSNVACGHLCFSVAMAGVVVRC